jgi:uncharacterized protein YkwD
MPNPRPPIPRLTPRPMARLLLAGLAMGALAAGGYHGLTRPGQATPDSGVLFANLAPDTVWKLKGAGAPLMQEPLLLDPSTWALPTIEAEAAVGSGEAAADVAASTDGQDGGAEAAAPELAPPSAPPPAPQPPAAPVAAARPAAPPPTPAPTATPPPAPPPASVGLSAQEQQVFDGQNAERAKVGLAPLRLDPALEAVARRRAQDMASRGYFSHTSPTGETAFTLIAAAGIYAPYAGENIGYNTYPDATSAAAILSGFLASAAHRANIVGPHYTRVGVASAVGANGTRYYAVVFAGP